MNRKVLVGGAWPYANGSLHIGHIAALIPGDVLARYYRANNDLVVYVSGSDCHGTPISIRAHKENVTPESIAQKYHEEFTTCFQRLNFTFDKYTNTMNPYHEKFVQQFFSDLIANGSLYEKEVKQVYCSSCNKFLPDRYVNGTCPVCGADARGDQCDACGSLLEPEQLENMRCAICGSKPTLQPSSQLYLNIIKFKDTLESYVNDHENVWRQNAVNESKKYINSGLEDRAATRDLDWGIEVPREGYGHKRIYVWFEAVLGYVSAAKEYCQEKDIDFGDFWSNSLQYYVHGKDNIPFHTIILPSLLLSHGETHLPDRIISSEYMTLEGRKISTSAGWAVWLPYLIENYNSDTIRLFFVAFGPENKDADFSWSNFITFHNSQLLGGYGNLVNRTLAFINKYNESHIPEGSIDPLVCDTIKEAFKDVSLCIEQGHFRDAVSSLFALVNYGNKYYDNNKPWITRTSNPQDCNNTLYNCVQIIAALATMFHPFIPESSAKVEEWLKIDSSWEQKAIPAGLEIPQVSVLFERIDKKQIEFETELLAVKIGK